MTLQNNTSRFNMCIFYLIIDRNDEYLLNQYAQDVLFVKLRLKYFTHPLKNIIDQLAPYIYIDDVDVKLAQLQQDLDNL